MNPLTLILWAVALLGVSGMPGLLLSRRSSAGQMIALLLSAAGSTLGLTAVVRFFFSDIRIAMERHYSATSGPSLPIDGPAVTVARARDQEVEGTKARNKAVAANGVLQFDEWTFTQATG